MKLLPPLLLIVLFGFVPVAGGTETIVLRAGTPLFRTAELSAHAHRPLVLMRDVSGVEVAGRSVYRFEQHPLMRKLESLCVRMPDGMKFWISKRMRYAPGLNRGRGGYEYLPHPAALGLAAFFLLASGVGGFGFLRAQREKKPGRALGWALFALLGLRYGALALLCHTAAATGFFPSDEYGYFEAARGIASGDWSGPWRYTVGLPFCYVPFIKLLGADCFPGIESAFSRFNALFVAPAALLLGFGVLYKLSGRLRAAFTAAALTEVFFFFHQYRDMIWKGVYVYKSFFGTVPSDWCYELHSKFLLYGLHAGSENWAMLLVFGGALWILCDRNAQRPVAVSALIFAFACLVRINNIFFAPLYVFLLWNRLLPEERRFRRLIPPVLLGAGVFLLGFLPQLYANFRHFGSIFTFPYILHDAEVYKGFVLANVPEGFRFICGTAWVYLASGAVGMLFIGDGKLRLALALWSVPLMVFFSGYPALGAGSTRFLMIVYPALVAGMVFCDLWRTLPERLLFPALGFVGLNWLLTAPGDPRHPLLPWGWEKLSRGAEFAAAGAAVAVLWGGFAVWKLRYYRRELFILLVFGALYQSACVPAVALLLISSLAPDSLRARSGKFFRHCLLLFRKRRDSAETPRG